ncbi:MAG: MFS transporter, partial [Paludibacter sp.]|nr:MFS transporter [Paludibacter sp.]
ENKTVVDVSVKTEKLSIREMARAIIHTPSLLPVFVADTASNCTSFLLPTLAVYYWTHVAEKPEWLALQMLVMSICGVCGAFNSRFLMRKFAIRTACLLVYPFITVLLFSTRFVADSPLLFIAVSAIAQFFISNTQPMENKLYLDAAEYSERETGISAKGSILSIATVADVGATLIRNLVISAVFIIIGYTAVDVSDAIKQRIVDTYSLLPALFPVIAWVSMFFFYKLAPEKKRINNEK